LQFTIGSFIRQLEASQRVGAPDSRVPGPTPPEHPLATLSQVADHIDHIRCVWNDCGAFLFLFIVVSRALIGAEHIGLGGDFDGCKNLAKVNYAHPHTNTRTHTHTRAHKHTQTSKQTHARTHTLLHIFLNRYSFVHADFSLICLWYPVIAFLNSFRCIHYYYYSYNYFIVASF
jgi:hypothetical protein